MYAELAVTSNFSFLRGASHPEELAVAAARLGLAGIGITDRNSVAGVVRAHMAAKEARLRLAVGARLVFADGTPDILAYPRDRAAWGRLTRLLSLGKRRAEKGDCILRLADLVDFSAGLNLIVMPLPPPCPPPRGTPPRLRGGDPVAGEGRVGMAALPSLLARLKDAGASVWLAAGMLYRGDDARRLARLADIAATTAVPLIAVNDVLYHSARRRALQDILTCIREHVTIDAAGRRLEANAERHLKRGAEMARLFRRHPDAVRQTIAFLESCRFSLDELKNTEYPDETRKGYATPQEALVAFAEAGARRRYPDGIPDKVRHALSEELRLIGELNYAPFFLTVHDIVKYAREEEKILCQGRGSAANSVICYCLGITDVDPLKIDLLFERFVSAERNEPPDIDVDFEHERRELVIQHIYRTYTRERAGLAATVICYRGRSAIRDVGKAFGLSEDTIGALAGSLWGWSMEGVTAGETKRLGLDPSDRRLKMARSFARVLMGFPRHLSQHVGGFVITRSRLDEVVPIENAAMEDRTVIEWDKDDLDAMGLLKVDVLGLGMLSCLKRSFDLMREHYGVTRNLSMQDEDEAVYRMIQRADTIGVFQIESRAQMSMLPRLRPQEFYDLVIEVAIVRPGPIQGDMVHPYLRRRQGLEPVHYHSPELEAILKKTLGVPLFQEHAMRIAIVAAGFAPSEADKLRRAMATFKRVGTIKYFRDKFINGMTSRGYPADFAARCFSQIEGFGEYGFPESHAASFANLVYASAWIKCRYPDVFACALLNSQPMGFYAPAQIVRDAQEHGVEVRAVDVNHSNRDCSLEPLPCSRQFVARIERQRNPGTLVPGFAALNPGYRTTESRENARPHLHPRHAEMRHDIGTARALRLGFRQVSGLSEEDGLRIEAVRHAGFDSVRDFWLRTGLATAAIERLAAADAFRSLGLDRRDALWAVKALQRSGDKDDLPLLKRVEMPELEPDAGLPPMCLGEQVVEDYRRLHLSLKAHPVAFLRADLARRGILRHEELAAIPSGRRVTVGGLVLVRQRPGTAAGVIFMTLEDETAIANTIVWPKIFETFRPVVLGARLVSVTGKLQNESGVIHVVAERIEDLTPLLRRLSQDHGCVEEFARADAVKHPNTPDLRELHRHPRGGDALVTLFRDQPALASELGLTAKVMPKGRNFQ